MKNLARRATSVGFILNLIWACPAFAQPWLATRYAQNCAACHAPGRLNKPASERRCTLSCQGCHVNPNGGGLQTFYGVWNQQRWLRSVYVDGLLTNKKKPSPFGLQLYGRKKDSAKPTLREELE